MKVLVIEDSLVVRRYVCALLDAEPDIEVLEASDGVSGLADFQAESPDLILTDLMLPGLSGIEIIKAVMRERPRPIIVLSGHLHDTEKDLAFEALDAGAVEVLAKPSGLGQTEQGRFRVMLLKTVRLMANVPVVGRRRVLPGGRDRVEIIERPEAGVDVVAIGASTGGPPLLHDMLVSFEAPLIVPVLVVQHIVPGFEASFADWLARTGHDVRVATHDEQVVAGRVYIAPATADVRIGELGALQLTPHDEGRMSSTSVDTLFESVAERYGPRAWGILLTGMGIDGAAGLLEMKRRGAFTIAQDGASCTIESMPAAARTLGAAASSMTPHEIWATLRMRFGSENPQVQA